MKALATFAIVAFGMAAIGAAPTPATLRGYTPASSARERDIESRFVDMPSAARALDDSAVIGERPHYAGSTGDYALAVYVRDTMRTAGIPAELQAFRSRVDTPRELSLALAPDADQPRSQNKHRFAEFPVRLELGEVAEPTDPATGARGIGLPFNSGSADGDVRAPLVYADRGLDADYETLATARVDVRGAVVLVRYGAQFRGLLAERAQSRGAIGVLFYSDPKDDGSGRGPVYPDGPWRPLTAIQRGSVGDNVHIPTLPVSAANAAVLLESLRGNAGPATWGGALPVAYPLARGPGRVHLVVKLTRKIATLWNTIGVIDGTRSDQRLILGAHRDAWVGGVGDNGDGVTTMLEVARGLGSLLRGGWRPKRTIVIAGWDGEEIGLAGSRAYTRAHRIELERGCLAYLNADENVTGSHFSADAVAAIAPLVIDAAQRVLDPAIPATTLYDRWTAQTPHRAPVVESPGGGSDHEPFLYDLGIPVSNMLFSGPFGVYHSSYDTLRYATLFSDPGFGFHRAAAQLYGLVALRLADADSVPYTFAGYVGLLRAGASQIAARAARDRLEVDLRPLRRAVDGFAVASVRVDSLIARGSLDQADGEFQAARDLDSLVYGVNGYSSVAFPRIDRAISMRDAGMLNDALSMAVRTLGHTTAALSSVRQSKFGSDS